MEKFSELLNFWLLTLMTTFVNDKKNLGGAVEKAFARAFLVDATNHDICSQFAEKQTGHGFTPLGRTDQNTSTWVSFVPHVTDRLLRRNCRIGPKPISPCPSLLHLDLHLLSVLQVHSSSAWIDTSDTDRLPILKMSAEFLDKAGLEQSYCRYKPGLEQCQELGQDPSQSWTTCKKIPSRLIRLFLNQSHCSMTWQLGNLGFLDFSLEMTTCYSPN